MFLFDVLHALPTEEYPGILVFSCYCTLQDAIAVYVGCIYVIRLSLLGSYVCLIITRLATVDIFIAKNTVQLVDTKLLLLVGSAARS